MDRKPRSSSPLRRSLRVEGLEPRRLLAVLISEFLASNQAGQLSDVDGDESDWIEIRNSGTDPVDLAGWHLTDDSQQLDRWTFPHFELSPESYVVVFASGKNRTTTGEELHTNFKLQREGEYLALVRPNATTIVSQFGSLESDYVEQHRDVSFGITLAPGSLEPGEFFMLQPTPGADNALGYFGVMDATQVSVPRGFYTTRDLEAGGPLAGGVSLLAGDEAPAGTQLYYTTDGSPPSPENPGASPYIDPLTIATTTTLRVAAFADGYVPSRVDTHTYLFLADVLQQDGAGFPELTSSDYEMDPDIVNDPRFSDLETDLKALPTVSLVLPVDDVFGPDGMMENPTKLGREWEREASIELIQPDGTGGFQENAGLRIQGAGSRARSFSKKGFQVFFRGEYGAKKLEYPYFGEGRSDEIDRIAFRGNFFDSWTFNNSGVVGGACCGYDQALLFRDQFGHETHDEMGALTIAGNWVHLYINGQYWGLYNSVERPDEQFAEYYIGGDADNYDVLKQRPRGQADGSAPEVVHGNRDAWDQLMELIRGDIETDEVYQQVRQVLDVEQFADYVLLNVFGGNFDWPHNNWYAMRERTEGSRWTFISWDTENFIFNVNADRSDFSTDNSPGIIYHQLRKNSEFRLMFADHVHGHLFNDGALTPARNLARFERIVDGMAAGMNAESARWGDTHTDSPRNTIDTWLTVVEAKTQDYFPRRTGIVLEQLIADELYTAQDAAEFYVNRQPAHGGFLQSGDAVQLVQLSASYVNTVLVNEGASMVAYIPAADEFSTTAWTDVDFDPSTDPQWSTALIQGTTGVGYDSRGNYGPWINTDVSDMTGQSGSLLTRIEFLHNDSADFDRVLLHARYDDGFVAYLNGVEVARSNNIRVQLPPQAARASSHRARENFEIIDVTMFEDLLVDGRNVLAFQVINSSPSNVDLLMVPKLVASDLDLDFQNDNIWVTLDGSDPRDATTDLPSEAATRLTDDLQLTSSTTVRARVFDGVAWSALNEATFDVATTGDLNHDGQMDAADIDLLAAAIRDPDSLLDYDLTDDGVTDEDDRAYLVESLLGTTFGDANLDGVFDSNDLVGVFSGREYEDDVPGNSTWVEGDWDGNGEFESDDLVLAFIKGGYVPDPASTPHPVAAAVDRVHASANAI